MSIPHYKNKYVALSDIIPARERLKDLQLTDYTFTEKEEKCGLWLCAGLVVLFLAWVGVNF